MTYRRARFRLSLPAATTTALLPLAHALLSLDLALVARPRALRSPLFHYSAPFSSPWSREAALAADLGAVAASYAVSGVVSALVATTRNVWNDARAWCGADSCDDTDTSHVPFSAWSATAPAVYLLAMVLVAAHPADSAWPYPLDFGTLLTVPLAFLLVFTEHHFARLYATLWKKQWREDKSGAAYGMLAAAAVVRLVLAARVLVAALLPLAVVPLGSWARLALAAPLLIVWPAPRRTGYKWFV
ncbi:uncharacterized protein LOC62_01G001579 [Vanrija pseudolonga]|uniref:Uncharacterized protein n=1 Tax=Vanrija pseudolonga TaxID=143232 RepID=A0AAF1BG18_9TREE|nr:hypothetical protein LOC62_01G001579 [Vanrija pseudolonga]